MEPLRLHWEGKDKGWILDTVLALDPHHVKYVIEKTLPIQIERWRSLPPGDMKDDLEFAIKELQKGKVNQWVIPGNSHFQSTERTSPKKTFYME